MDENPLGGTASVEATTPTTADSNAASSSVPIGNTAKANHPAPRISKIMQEFSLKNLMAKEGCSELFEQHLASEAKHREAREQEQRLHDEQEQRLRTEREQTRREKLKHDVAPYMCRASDELPKLEPVISQYGQTICSRGNISAIVGDAKSKKTFLCTAIVSSLHRQNNDDRPLEIDYRPSNVLWIDTEQSLEHIQRVQYRINIMTNQPIKGSPSFISTLALREQKVEDRVAITEKAIDGFRPALVVIDGVSDLMYNTNAVDESEAVIAMLLTWSSKYDCHIMVVLHTNPDSDKARGHIGSALRRKVEAMLFVHRIGDVSVVEPRFCRNAEFERFAFHIVPVSSVIEQLSPDFKGLGLPERCPLPTESSDSEDDCLRILRDELGGVAERKLLVSKIVALTGVTENNARVKITRAINKGYLLSDNNAVITIPPH